MYCQNRISIHTGPPTQATILHCWQQRMELKIYNNLPIAQMWQSKPQTLSFLQNIRHAAQDIVIFSEEGALLPKPKKSMLVDFNEEKKREKKGQQSLLSWRQAVCNFNEVEEEKYNQLFSTRLYVTFEYCSGGFLIGFTSATYDREDSVLHTNLEMVWRCLNSKIRVHTRHVLHFLQNTRAMMPWYLLFDESTSNVCWVNTFPVQRINDSVLTGFRNQRNQKPGFKKKNDSNDSFGNRTNFVTTTTPIDGFIHHASCNGGNGGGIAIFPFAGFQYAFGRVTQPSTVQMRYHLHQLRRELREHRTATQEELIQILTPWVRAWKAYYEFSSISSIETNAVSKTGSLYSPYLREHNLPEVRLLAKYCDHALLQMLWRWSCRRHPKKSRTWVKQKYFHVLQKKKWVFAVWDSSNLTYTSLPSHGASVDFRLERTIEANFNFVEEQKAL